MSEKSCLSTLFGRTNRGAKEFAGLLCRGEGSAAVSNVGGGSFQDVQDTGGFD